MWLYIVWQRNLCPRHRSFKKFPLRFVYSVLQSKSLGTLFELVGTNCHETRGGQMQKHFGNKTKKSLGVLHTSSLIHSVGISKFYSHDNLTIFCEKFSWNCFICYVKERSLWIIFTKYFSNKSKIIIFLQRAVWTLAGIFASS